MKIVRLTAENVKKLRTVEITPAGSIVQITGPNGSGKSSVLDAIYYALAGTKDIPSRPVRNGQKKAVVSLDLGDIIVTRRFTESGGTSLTVEAADGARYPSPQKMLDDLLGTLTFDPLAFSRMDPRKQLEQLRGVVKLDVDIDAIDAANKIDYDARTEANRAAKTLRAQAEAIQVTPGTPDQPIDTQALLDGLQRAGDANGQLAIRRERREQRAAQARQLRDAAKAAEATIADLERQLQEHRARLTTTVEDAEAIEHQIASAEPLPPPADLTTLRADLDRANLVNAAVANRMRRSEIETKVAQHEAESERLTAEMDARSKQRSDAIAAAGMPVPGLSFGEGEVLYNGIPFAQASSAEQLRVSIAIAMAANPKLRVMRIKDGSLLDENGLRMVAEMATSEDFQVWIEQVDTTGRVGIVMEDGAVRSADLPEAA